MSDDGIFFLLSLALLAVLCLFFTPVFGVIIWLLILIVFK